MSSIRQAFEPVGDIDPVAMDVIALDNNVIKIDVKAELNAFVFGYSVIAGRHCALEDRDSCTPYPPSKSDFGEGDMLRLVP